MGCFRASHWSSGVCRFCCVGKREDLEIVGEFIGGGLGAEEPAALRTGRKSENSENQEGNRLGRIVLQFE